MNTRLSATGLNCRGAARAGSQGQPGGGLTAVGCTQGGEPGRSLGQGWRPDHGHNARHQGDCSAAQTRTRTDTQSSSEGLPPSLQLLELAAT